MLTRVEVTPGTLDAMAEALDGTAQSLSPVRARLLGLDLVETLGRDMLGSALPDMRECLLGRAVTEWGAEHGETRRSPSASLALMPRSRTSL